jgi:hypothetical protein
MSAWTVPTGGFRDFPAVTAPSQSIPHRSLYDDNTSKAAASRISNSHQACLENLFCFAEPADLRPTSSLRIEQTTPALCLLRQTAHAGLKARSNK